jgi:hypothetical protein
MAAACLKAFDDGITRKLDPGEPEERNIYQAMEQGKIVKKLPMSLGEALNRLADDKVIQSAMPGDMYRLFHEYKTDEWERFMATTTNWDMETYLDCLHQSVRAIDAFKPKLRALLLREIFEAIAQVSHGLFNQRAAGVDRVARLQHRHAFEQSGDQHAELNLDAVDIEAAAEIVHLGVGHHRDLVAPSRLVGVSGRNDERRSECDGGAEAKAGDRAHLVRRHRRKLIKLAHAEHEFSRADRPLCRAERRS